MNGEYVIISKAADVGHLKGSLLTIQTFLE